MISKFRNYEHAYAIIRVQRGRWEISAAFTQCVINQIFEV